MSIFPYHGLVLSLISLARSPCDRKEPGPGMRLSYGNHDCKLLLPDLEFLGDTVEKRNTADGDVSWID